MTTDRILTTDPAAVTDQSSMILVTNVFQRLIMSNPGESEVAPAVWAFKPDLARECSFTSRTTFTCSLNENLKFSNGDKITSSDVKFSIERAIRLDISGSSTSAFASLRRIETPDSLTVKFLLDRYDRQFGWALAGPAGSVVNRKIYAPDKVQRNDQAIVGSGPFKVVSFDEKKLTLAKYQDYIGRTAAKTPSVQILTEPDSLSIESALNSGQTDMVWRGLSSAALTRLNSQIQASPDAVTKSGFTRLVLPGARVLQLKWNTKSTHRSNKALRDLVAGALQEDRTLDSVVPPQVPGHRSSFPLGGKSNADVEWTGRISLTLGYNISTPDGEDIAHQILSRLESTSGISVNLQPGNVSSDLWLGDLKAWTPTALTWLQPVIEDPLKSSSDVIRRAQLAAQVAEDPNTLSSALGVLQAQAAKDDLIIPLKQTDEFVYVGPHAEITGTSFGPGWQLGLWGIQDV